MTEKITPTNGSLPHRVARLESEVDRLREKLDRQIIYFFAMSAAFLLSIIGTLVTVIIV